MLSINNQLNVFVESYKMHNIVKDLYEDPDVRGMYICELTNLDRVSGMATVYINTLRFSITTPLFYTNNVDLGDTLLVYLDDPNNGKIIGLHSKSYKYRDEEISDKNILKFGKSEIIIRNDSIIFRIGDTDHVFQSNGMTVLCEELLTNYQINLPSMASLNVQDLDIVGSSIDINLGSMNGLTRRLPFTSTRPSGFGVRSMFGNIDLTTTTGAVNISSMLNTNINAGACLNLLSGGTAGIFAPFISNLTMGFGAPLIPSPVALMAMPEIINNFANPFRTPNVNSATHIMNKFRVVMP